MITIPLLITKALNDLFTQAASIKAVSSSPWTCTGGSLYIVAHPDDDLLFQSPDLPTEIGHKTCITSIYLTAGDAGAGPSSSYARDRETGNKQAYALMAGVKPDSPWKESTVKLGGQSVALHTLTAAPHVQHLWFRLPDGNGDGTGFSGTGGQSLKKVYTGSASSIGGWSLSDIKSALGDVIKARKPSIVRTQDWTRGWDGSYDHPDHAATARIVREVAGGLGVGVVGYVDYAIQDMPVNVPVGSANYTAKSNAFWAYAPFDSKECQSLGQCVKDNFGEDDWLQRQYYV
ncbi:hypothetical protein EJ06DRAFT_553058 [Trichodelitschia bisporula]|uniref:N-acetylglucosaminylphosphatidylinositol deacetylase n=1 Tax=Trichodelitschia bisporula TaxID=703511 RepID=A0A6G1I740_9PEZI|nr:hypothetical protein EJ06DRAFT_553058 [Trichodelitschia bisporula]